MKIQDKINKLKPHVIGIRFTQGLTIVDVILKDHWVMDETENIKIGKSEETPNYYMVYSGDGDLDVDQILEFIELVINKNVEQENKIELLGKKIIELENLFESNSLEVLQSLNYTFNDLNKQLSVIPSIKVEEVIINVEEPILVPLLPLLPPTVETEDVILPKTKNKFVSSDIINNLEFDLPPRGSKIELETFEPTKSVCKCQNGDMCEICLEM